MNQSFLLIRAFSIDVQILFLVGPFVLELFSFLAPYVLRKYNQLVYSFRLISNLKPLDE